jgi:rhodanese-related sulfurtransferase
MALNRSAPTSCLPGSRRESRWSSLMFVPPRSIKPRTLPGAVSIPLEELEQRLRELPHDREIVAYCRGPYCAFAPEAVRTLRAHGHAARHLTDGLPERVAAGNGFQLDGTGVPKAD